MDKWSWAWNFQFPFCSQWWLLLFCIFATISLHSCIPVPMLFEHASACTLGLDRLQTYHYYSSTYSHCNQIKNSKVMNIWQLARPNAFFVDGWTETINFSSGKFNKSDQIKIIRQNILRNPRFLFWIKYGLHGYRVVSISRRSSVHFTASHKYIMRICPSPLPKCVLTLSNHYIVLPSNHACISVQNSCIERFHPANVNVCIPSLSSMFCLSRLYVPYFPRDVNFLHRLLIIIHTQRIYHHTLCCTIWNYAPIRTGRLWHHETVEFSALLNT